MTKKLTNTIFIHPNQKLDKDGWPEKWTKAQIKRIGELWDEGIASGPAGELDIEEVLARARNRLADKNKE